MIVLNSVKEIDLMLYDEVWYITNNTPNQHIGTKHVPDLAPSRSVYNAYRYGALDFDDLASSYKEQLNHNTATLEALNKLIQEADTKWIQCVCYCDDVNTCHRKVLYEHLISLGVKGVKLA